MIPDHDNASPILLCVEEYSCALGFDDGVEDEEEGQGHTYVSEQKRCDFYGDLVVDFPLQSEEFLDFLVGRECEYLPREDYLERLRSGALDSSIRRDAIEWILKVHAQYNFDPLSAYLSVNYLDRFLSSYELPKGKIWMTQLLSVACLSLAAKMEETEVPLYLDLQVGDAKYVFEARTIQRMELLVLSTLKWRMQAVTPFSFIDFFLHKFSTGNVPIKETVSRSMEVILSTIRGIDFLAFRPSEIAAAIVLLVVGEKHNADVEKTISCCSQVAKDQVLRCYQWIKGRKSMKSRTQRNDSVSISSVPESPNGVLDAACLSYKSNDITVQSQAECHHNSPFSKRRKLSKS